ncbi:MAG: hypothetical protein ABL958_19055 [Bdellovibrionia bacterium]
MKLTLINLVTFVRHFLAVFGLVATFVIPAHGNVCSSFIVDTKKEIQIARDRSFDVMMDMNGRFPQMRELIKMAVLAEFLSGEIALAEVVRPATDTEIRVLGQRMNRIHEAYHIPVHTVDFKPEIENVRRITYEDVGFLADTFLWTGLLRTASKALTFIDPTNPKFKEIRANAQTTVQARNEISEIYREFQKPENKELLSRCKGIGRALTKIMKSKETADLSKRWKDAVQYRSAEERGEAKGEKPKPVGSIDNTMETQMLRALREEMPGEKFDEAFVTGLMWIFTGM